MSPLTNSSSSPAVSPDPDQEAQGSSPGLDMVERAAETLRAIQADLEALVASADAVRVAVDRHEARARTAFRGVAKVQKLHARLCAKLRKPKRKGGFAFPIPVTNEMCDFMNVPHGQLVARAEFSKRLASYAREHKLSRKGYIVRLDAVLQSLFDKSASEQEPFSFIMAQKYAAPHFRSVPLP